MNITAAESMSDQIRPSSPRRQTLPMTLEWKLDYAIKDAKEIIAVIGRTPRCTSRRCLQHLYIIPTQNELPLGRDGHAVRCLGTSATIRRRWTVCSLSNRCYGSTPRNSSCTAVEYEGPSVIPRSGWSVRSQYLQMSRRGGSKRRRCLCRRSLIRWRLGG